MSAAERLRKAQLKLDNNPFGPGASGLRTGRPLQTALGELIRHIGLETPVVIVAGSAGTGKTMLVDMTARALGEMGLSVKRVDRGDLLPLPAGDKTDVLLVDEADSITDAGLQALAPVRGKGAAATTTVLLCLPSSVLRLSTAVRAAVVQLQSMSFADARNYLLERSASIGRLDLFTPEATDLAINGSHGLPRLLRYIAEISFLQATLDGASEIALKHVAHALASQIPSGVAHDALQPVPTVPTTDLGAVKPKSAPSTSASERPAPKLVPLETDASERHRLKSKEPAAPVSAPQRYAPAVEREQALAKPDPASTDSAIATPQEAPPMLASPALSRTLQDELIVKPEPPPEDAPVVTPEPRLQHAPVVTPVASPPSLELAIPSRTLKDDLVAKPSLPSTGSPATAKERVEAPGIQNPVSLHIDIDDARQSREPRQSRRPRKRRAIVWVSLLLLAGVGAAISPRLLQVLSPPDRAGSAPALAPEATQLRETVSTPEGVLPPDTSAGPPPSSPPVPAPPPIRGVQATVPGGEQSSLPPGREYGANNTNSRLTLRIHRQVRVTVNGRNNRILLFRTLEPGDSYRVPRLPNVTVTATDLGAIELVADGNSEGFLGNDGVPADHMPLDR